MFRLNLRVRLTSSHPILPQIPGDSNARTRRNRSPDTAEVST
jgi:hypothetical protein